MASRRAAFLTPTNCSMQAQTLIRQRQSGFVLPFRVVIRIDTKKYTGRAPNNIEGRRRQSALICAVFIRADVFQIAFTACQRVVPETSRSTSVFRPSRLLKRGLVSP
jgi:hypothetical protein